MEDNGKQNVATTNQQFDLLIDDEFWSSPSSSSSSSSIDNFNRMEDSNPPSEDELERRRLRYMMEEAMDFYCYDDELTEMFVDDFNSLSSSSYSVTLNSSKTISFLFEFQSSECLFEGR